MSEISCTDGSLTVTLDGDHDSKRIRKFLEKRHFRLRDSVWTSRNTDPRLIIRIQNYIQSRSGEVNLDDRVQACVQAFQENELRFENRREAARQIKDTEDNSFGELPIQEFGINPATGQRWQESVRW